MEKSITLQCCENCNRWHEVKDYFLCSCGAETFTSEWLLAHPEHPAYQQYLKYLKENEVKDNG